MNLSRNVLKPRGGTKRIAERGESKVSFGGEGNTVDGAGFSAGLWCNVQSRDAVSCGHKEKKRGLLVLGCQRLMPESREMERLCNEKILQRLPGDGRTSFHVWPDAGVDSRGLPRAYFRRPRHIPTSTNNHLDIRFLHTEHNNTTIYM